MNNQPLTSQRIVLLGAGRVAAQLGPGLERAGHRVTHVWSRTEASASALARTLRAAQALGATAAPPLPAADLYLLAVPDAAVAEVLATVVFPPGALVAHTAGALPLAVFAVCPGVRGGVFYPLQTFSAGRSIDWKQVPLCVEAAEPAGEQQLLALAHSLSGQVLVVATPQRQALHVAAVFACNFTNHLLGISEALLSEARLPFGLLAPLIRETVEKALGQPPFTAQTGPAVRHDEATLALHRQALRDHSGWLAIYKLLTASIQKQNEAAIPNNQGDIQL